jgi:23S rRNA (uracil1939-C5)-methyltransferase
MSKTTIKTFISALSHDGRGIAHINGKTTFIANSLPQEEIIFEYVKRHNNYDEGKMVELLQSSPVRTEPLCPFFTICGGCNLQHLEHAEQILLKTKVLLEQLHHFGGTTPITVMPAITGPIVAYRSKARLCTKYVVKKAKVVIGFHEKNGRFIADISQCPILAEPLNNQIINLQTLITNLAIKQSIPQIEIAIGEQNVALIFRILDELITTDKDQLIAFGNLHNFDIYLQPHGLDSIYCITDKKPLSYTLPKQNIELFFEPTDFTQINREINKKLVTKAIELIAPKPTDNILDLFCGLGNFSLPIAQHCAHLNGIEGNTTMVTRATTNAAYNKITNASFYSADLTKNIDNAAWAKQQYNKILLDPPRTGALEIINNIRRFNAEKIIYISCNPATLARDTKELLKQGYTLACVGLVDMFPHTIHAEAIAEFIKT